MRIELALQKIVEESWANLYAKKPVEPYIANGKLINFSIDGSWPFDIFSAGFWAGVEAQKKLLNKKGILADAGV